MDEPRQCHTERSKSERGDISYDIPYMQNLKTNDTNELTYKTERDSHTQKTNLRLPGGRNSQGVWEGHVHPAIFKMGNKDYCTAHGILLNIICQPGWERDLGENGHMYMNG